MWIFERERESLKSVSEWKEFFFWRIFCVWIGNKTNWHFNTVLHVQTTDFFAFFSPFFSLLFFFFSFTLFVDRRIKLLPFFLSPFSLFLRFLFLCFLFFSRLFESQPDKQTFKIGHRIDVERGREYRRMRRGEGRKKSKRGRERMKFCWKITNDFCFASKSSAMEYFLGLS